MASKLTPEERLRRAVAKAARASDRAHWAAFRARRAWQDAVGLAQDMVPATILPLEDEPAVVLHGCVVTRVAEARRVEEVASTADHRGQRLARLMGVDGEVRRG